MRDQGSKPVVVNQSRRDYYATFLPQDPDFAGAFDRLRYVRCARGANGLFYIETML